MYHDFIKEVEELYELILQPIDNIYKFTGVTNFKLKFHIDSTLTIGEAFNAIMVKDKSKGVVFTPYNISDYMVKETISKEDIIKNPYLKVVDPACGAGNILIPAYRYIKELFINNLDKINFENKMNLTASMVDEHLISNVIYGFDIDGISLKILAVDLFTISGYLSSNLCNKDFLMESNENKYDIFIGNPPYIGHKSVEREYYLLLKEKYGEVYKDKSDVSYCFIKSALDKITKEGKLTYITSRYFIEAPSGMYIRKFIRENFSIRKVIDFYGIRPFKNAGIDPVIIALKAEKNDDNVFSIIRPLNTDKDNKKNFFKHIENHNLNLCKEFKMNKKGLSDDGWIFVNDIESKIIQKIESECQYSLYDICESYQGIITGCDKAFVVDKNTVKLEKIEKDIVKPWIKSTDIEKGYLRLGDKFIIYSNLILDEKEYPYAIKYISSQKERLLKRRECCTGVRKWYELQWGRSSEIFENKKIVFPYKSRNNRFAIDAGSYFSADVYSIKLKEEKWSYEQLIYLLNSDVYEFYFKTFAKKLGEDMYEYYPNRVMKVRIPNSKLINTVYPCGKKIYSLFKLNGEEIQVIKDYCRRQ